VKNGMSKPTIFIYIPHIICALFIGLLFGGFIVNTYYPKIIVEEIEETTITIAIGHGFHYSMPIIMEHFKLVDKYSAGTVNLKLVALKADAITEGLIGGSIQFGHRTGVAVIQNIDAGAPFKMLISVGRKERELWTSDPNIHSISDIPEGTMICTVTPTAIQTIGMKLALERIGRTIDYIEPLYITHTDAYQMMVTGELTMDYTGAPYTSRYANEPDKYHMIATDTEIFGMEMPASTLYATTEFVEENPEVVSSVISAWLEALGWIRNNGRETALIVAEFYGDPTDTAYDDWVDSKITFDPIFGMIDLPQLSELLYENGIISKAYTADEIMFPLAFAYP